MEFYKYRKDDAPKQLVEFLGIGEEQTTATGDVLTKSLFRFNFVNEDEISSKGEITTDKIQKGCEVSVFLNRRTMYHLDWGSNGSNMHSFLDNIKKFYLKDNHRLMALCRNNAKLSQIKPNVSVKLSDCIEKGFALTEQNMKHYEEKLLKEAFTNGNCNIVEHSYRGWLYTKDKLDGIQEVLGDFQQIHKILNKNDMTLFIKNAITEIPATRDDPGDIVEDISVSVRDSAHKDRVLFSLDGDPANTQFMREFTKKMEERADKENWRQTNPKLLERVQAVVKDFDGLLNNRTSLKNKTVKGIDNSFMR